jgi:hypothetical protein
MRLEEFSVNRLVLWAAPPWFRGIGVIQVLQVPFPPAKAIFVGIDVLLAVRTLLSSTRSLWCAICQAASSVSSSYDALLDLFECIGSFLQRLVVYTRIPPTHEMTDIIVKIMVELLSVLALATKQINQGRFSKLTTSHIPAYARLMVR